MSVNFYVRAARRAAPLRRTLAYSSSLLWLWLASAGCQVDSDSKSPAAEVPTASQPVSGGAALVSPELLELAGRWSYESLAASSARTAQQQDLVSYVRSRSPALAGEATRMIAQATSKPVVEWSGPSCRCSVWGAFSGYPVTSSSGPDWTVTNSGAAHTAHIYLQQSGSSGETTANLAPRTTELLTRMICITPDGSACTAGCSAKLYADVQYGSGAYAESHTWTIWNKAGTTQVSDGATLDLRTPYGGAGQRLFEAAVSAHQIASGTTFAPDELANAIKAGLGIYAAIQSGTPATIPPLLIAFTKSAMAIIHHDGGTNGSYTQQMEVTYRTFFDAVAPIDISYSPSTISPYALDLTSLINMKVRGYGYHSETGEIRSGYALAAYVSNFVCDGSVSQAPASTGFWRYDSYGGSPPAVAAPPLSAANLQSGISAFLQTATGRPVPVVTNQGSIQLGTCGDQMCDSFETPASCPSECGTCGDGVCNPRFENSSNCAADCNYCGDGVCYGNEDAYSCIDDCGYCGDGYCSSTEAQGWCPNDCGYCGDGVCNGNENSSNCSDCCDPQFNCVIN